MKKNLALALLLSLSAFANAQENANSKSDSKINFGVKAGYSLSNMKFFGSQIDPKSYFYVGILGEQSISSTFSVQAEILYTQIGGKESYPWVKIVNNNVVEMDDAEYDHQFNQIQVPVSLKYYFIPKLSASAGMNFGFNISDKIKRTDSGDNVFSTNSNAKTLNLFPFLGAEYKINDKFFVDARYNFNFIKINKGGIETKIGFLQAGVGYRFK
ncbi:porin family protein [Chryseobacterium lineare]